MFFHNLRRQFVRADPLAAARPQWPCASTFGGHKAVVRPDPIPNSAVKRSLADGSGCIASARVGCRQFFLKAEMRPHFGFFLVSIPGLR